MEAGLEKSIMKGNGLASHRAAPAVLGPLQTRLELIGELLRHTKQGENSAQAFRTARQLRSYSEVHALRASDSRG